MAPNQGTTATRNGERQGTLLRTECLCPAPFRSYVEALTFNVMVFRGRVFGSLSLDEVLRWAPQDGLSVLIRKYTRARSFSHLEERPCEPPERRQLCTGQEMCCHQEANLPSP